MLEALLRLPSFSGATYDVALESFDAHLVGLARKVQTPEQGQARTRAISSGRKKAAKGFAPT